jgi:hypothetical protein
VYLPQKEIPKVKPRFGELRYDESTESVFRTAFGLKESTLPLKKGQTIH